MTFAAWGPETSVVFVFGTAVVFVFGVPAPKTVPGTPGRAWRRLRVADLAPRVR
jgi:hypothetical protein